MRLLPLHWYWPTLKGLVKNIRAKESIYPFYASFKLTSRCHFGCPFCNVKKDPVPDLSKADIKAILRNLSRSPVLMTSFEGGEPLLRDDIGELLKYAHQCKFYLLFTTSVKDLLSYPIDEYARYIDFLHISIDEGHDNLELLKQLPDLVKYLPCQVSVQTVVTGETISALDSKVRACYDAGANIVIIPATHMDETESYFPDMGKLERQINSLRRRFPETIHTPRGFFKAYRRHKCSSGSVIIAPDGWMYYPCHILGEKGPDLRHQDLSHWLTTPQAVQARQRMRQCTRNCGWYQYYAIDSYTSLLSIRDALRPIFRKKRK